MSTTSGIVKSVVLIAAAASLTACNFTFKSDSWHVGTCTSAIIKANPFAGMFGDRVVEMSMNQVIAQGLNPDDFMKGYKSYNKGDDVSISCKIAKNY